MFKKCLIGVADPFIARLIIRFVERMGYEVILAPLSDCLVDLVESKQPGSIILDVDLPGSVSSEQVIQDLQNSANGSHIPIVLCSWLNNDEAHHKYGNVSGYIQKSNVHYEELRDLLNASLGG